MSSTVTGSDGTQIPLEDVALSFAYSGSFVSTITCEYPPSSGKIFVQTFTNNGTSITTISGWVLQ
jgi:hypothetical protein